MDVVTSLFVSFSWTLVDALFNCYKWCTDLFVDTIVHLYVLVFPASSIRTLVRGMVTMQTCMWHASAVFSYVYPSVPAVGIGVLKKDH
jgi:hypothetical protein